MADRPAIVELLKLFKEEKFKKVLNDDGAVVFPSAQIFIDLSNAMDHSLRFKPKYIYTLLILNRYSLHTKILDFYKIIYVPSGKKDISLDDTLDGSICFDVDVTSIWKKIETETVDYEHQNRGMRRVGTLKRWAWTHALFEKIFEATKIKCPLTFKRSKTSQLGYAVTVDGHCPECDCVFKGYIVNQPTESSPIIRHWTSEMKNHLIYSENMC